MKKNRILSIILAVGVLTVVVTLFRSYENEERLPVPNDVANTNAGRPMLNGGEQKKSDEEELGNVESDHYDVESKSSLDVVSPPLTNTETSREEDSKEKISVLLNSIIDTSTGDIYPSAVQEVIVSKDFDEMIVQITEDNPVNISFSEELKQKAFNIAYNVGGIDDITVGCSTDLCMMKVTQESENAWQQFGEAFLADESIGNVFIGPGDTETKVLFSRLLDTGVIFE